MTKAGIRGSRVRKTAARPSPVPANGRTLRSTEGPSASELIDERIAELGDWRGETLRRMRTLIRQADPAVVEEWKWMDTPVWSHDGIICTGESYKSVVKLTFAKGASLKDPAKLFNASLDGNVRARSTSVRARRSMRARSRRSSVPRLRSTRPELHRVDGAGRMTASVRRRRLMLLGTLLIGVGACTVARGGRMQDVQHVSVYIDRRPAEVYEFASDPRNLPRWAAGLARSEVRRDGDEWVADAPFGKVKVRFAERNAFGVLDHDVTQESGVTVHNPMRVVPNGDGSEFIFTLIRRSGVSDREFADDKAAVEKDLGTLKSLLERDSRS